MARSDWLDFRFQNFNYDDIGSGNESTSDQLNIFHAGALLVRTQVWWDVRVSVQEDHTFQPRAPYPYVLDVYAAPGEGPEPPIGVPFDPVLTTMCATRPTESFGKIIGTAETQQRLWVGNSGGHPIESKAERSGDRDPGTWNMRARFSIYNDSSSPTGAIAQFPVLFLVRIRFLFKLSF